MLKSKHSQQKGRLFNKFKRYINSINILTRSSKANHYENFFQERQQNMLKTWEDMKSIIDINTTKNRSINYLNVNFPWDIKSQCQVSPRHYNSGLVTCGTSLTSWGEGTSLALVGRPSSQAFQFMLANSESHHHSWWI